MKKFYFIGDIHGCAEELDALIQKINPSKDDVLVSVGDIVNKGPRSEEAVQLLIKHNAKAVLGNHDSIIKRIFLKRTQGISPDLPIKETHDKLYDSLSESSIQYIVNLPLTLYLEEINTRVVHAGIAPFKALKENTEEELTCIRIVDPQTKEYIKRTHFGYPWYYYYTGDERIIYGHNAAKSIKMRKNTIGIDTGCLYGEKLTAYCLPDDRFIDVKAKKIYNDYTQGGKYSMPL